jgi:hypothetical protein
MQALTELVLLRVLPSLEVRIMDNLIILIEKQVSLLSGYNLNNSIFLKSLLNDANALGKLICELGAFYIMDRGYIDWARLYQIAKSGHGLEKNPSSMRSGVLKRYRKR